jgi:AraC-like DNA-binding protein
MRDMSLLTPAPDVFVLANFVTPIVRALREHAGDADIRLASLGLTPSTLDEPSARIPHATWVALLELGCEATNDTGFGLLAASMIDETAMDLGRYLAGDKATMRKVFMHVRPFLHAFHGGVQVSLEEDAALTRCSFTFGDLPAPPVLMEYVIARAIMLGRRMLGANYRAPLRIDFRHRRTVELARYETLLGAPVRFNADHDALVFPREHLDLPVLPLGIVRGSELRSLNAVATKLPYRLRARAHLLRNLANGDVSLEGAAAHLGLHPRTLRRRLAAEETSHAAILDSLRQERAIELLTDGTNVATTTLELGFSEPAAFRRAFRRWTGTNPSSFARKLRSATT